MHPIFGDGFSESPEFSGPVLRLPSDITPHVTGVHIVNLSGKTALKIAIVAIVAVSLANIAKAKGLPGFKSLPI